MNKYTFGIILLVLFFSETSTFGNSLLHLSVRDSVGTITKNGKKYIQYHIEDDAETLEEISQEYAVPIDEILEANPTLKNNQKLQVGAIISVPIIENIKYYRIMPGDNLFRIAKKTGMTVAKLREINSITNQYITAGHLLLVEKNPETIALNTNELIDTTLSIFNTVATDTLKNHLPLAKDKVRVPIIHIVKRGDGLRDISKKYNVSIDSLEKMNDFNRNSWLERGRKFIVGYKNVMPPANRNAGNPNFKNNILASEIIDTLKTLASIKTVKSALPAHIKKKGIGARVKANNRDNNTQKTAFHRTATIGSFMRVTNPSNGRGIVVRVIGRIPNTDKDKKLIVKISQATCKILGLVNDRFPIEIAYNQ